ncbi:MULTISPECIES: low molecular weight protein-tyrosine-phosphatase [unclassified Corynebacterium]|uniref:low molecular weight protein-tyrosine-phosphatase n=1 Tax=unclassified Corynebacterium TaxID=2624378 RepID=UPI0029CA9234|nr:MULTISPECIES: low molecular weight protein-tyrosine-phosphatase [unclassified Corynebacterium]WPF65512.1 low molecular weight protein-tyrosine-phosphatase [Corynebacterium sp. 22KM0430]WPF68008.1 low molecular weight protein-tyrosine-phosphatase [Corynebacterium sp. 21KM1197]
MTLHIDFVCTGNICRSPMAEVMLRDAAAQAGLSTALTVTSCGLGGWHEGEPADSRTLSELAARGHDGSTLRASQFSPDDAQADLLVALDTGHRSRLIVEHGIPAERVRLLRSFDPDSPEEASVADPYYGGQEGFRACYEQIDAALPGLLDWVRAHREAER